jgi:signal transduction histidine kinase
VKVTLSFGADCFRCRIADNGVGFDLASLPQPQGIGGGFGLPGMVERAESVGGEVEVSSAPGRGTVVAFTAPIAGEAELPLAPPAL